ncbi:hypothetical protein [Solirubrobacter soli]|uniref:hypothetical protein n=1 Tax=Solirubrobacter soli TaxID=363832 RepID=UPI00040A112E|nr:hypothetical protein [Solirubrobacter soli]
MRIVLLVLAAALAAPAAARADVRIPLPRTLRGATYGGGQVLYATHRGDGPIQVVGAPRSGALATLPAFSRDALVSLAANAGGYLVAVRDFEREFLAQGGYDGSLRTLVDCRAGGDPPGAELTMSAGTVGFAIAGARCGTPAPVDLVAPDGTITPVPGPVIHEDNLQLSYAEPFLSVTVVAGSDAGTVRVFDLADGTHRDFPAGYAGGSALIVVRADGTLVVAPGDDVGQRHPRGLYVWEPGAPAPRLLTRNAEPFWWPFASASEVLYPPNEPVDGQLGLALTPLDGGPIRPAGAPGIGAPREALGLDGATAVIGSFSCQGELQVTLVETPSASRRPFGCPVRVTGRSAATLGFTCRNGCRTRFELDQRSTPAQPCSERATSGEIPPPHPTCELLATVTLRLGPSSRARRVPLRLTDAGRLARRRHVQLPVMLVMDDNHPGPELIGEPDRTLRF